jgi:hypothetical protein
MGLIQFALNLGLMKPRREFTLIAGKEDLGVRKFYSRLTGRT